MVERIEGNADPTRPALEALRNEFARAAQKYPPLYHQQLIAFDRDDIAAESWSAFVASNPSKDWQAWHGPVEGEDLDWFGRFYGTEAGFAEFKQLGDSLFSVIRQLDPKWNPVEEEKNWDGDVGACPDGYEQCLDLLHRIAAHWPMPLIRSTESRWGLGEDHDRKKQAIGRGRGDEELTDEELAKLEELDALEESVEEGEGGVVYMVHPWIETLDANLFSAFAALIEVVLDKDKAFFISIMHWSEPEIPTLEKEDKSEPIEVKQTSGEAPKMPSAHLFRLDGKTWRIRYPDDNGGKECLVPDVLGLHHYHKLLREPGRRQTIADFLPGFVDESVGAGTGLTRKEIRETERKIKRWREEADIAEKEGALARAAELRKRAEDTEQWLKKEVGALGKPRPVKTPKQKAALDKIKVYMARARTSLREFGMHSLADHLERTCKPRWGGTEWRYQVTPFPDWDL